MPEALVAGLSVRKTGKKLKIHFTTAFRWRHRWLQRLRDMKDRRFNDIVEVDETYFLHSMKGARGWRKSRPSELPISREPRQRGGKALRRGLSREQVSVLVGLVVTSVPKVTLRELPDLNGLHARHGNRCRIGGNGGQTG